MEYGYFNNCVNWDRSDVHCDGGLCNMIAQAGNITRRTFLKHVDHDALRDVNANLGYCDHPSQGLTMAGDFAVSYYRSKLHGKRVYYFTNSAVEYVFTS